MWSLSISDSVLSTRFLGARIDLSAEDNAIALALAECPSRPYAKLIKSDVPGPSSSRSTRSAALRPSPPSTMKVPPVGLSAAKPTRGGTVGPVGDGDSEALEREMKNLGLR